MAQFEIAPASLAQVSRGRGGHNITISEDVGNIALKLKEIHPDLRLQYNELGNYFVVIQKVGEHEEHLVTTAQECDERLVEKVRRITSPGYDLVAEMDRFDAQAEKEADEMLREHVGEIGERLFHAIRKDLGYDQDRVFFPKK